MAQLCEWQPWHQLNSHMVSLQTCLVTFAYMAAQWPSFVGSKGSSSLCSEQAWPQGPRSLWDWLVQWNTCRRFDDDYLVLWGARYFYSTILHFFTCHTDLQCVFRPLRSSDRAASYSQCHYVRISALAGPCMQLSQSHISKPDSRSLCLTCMFVCCYCC